MIELNRETLEITCPSGDTGLLLVKITGTEGVPLPGLLDGVAIFAVAQKVGTGASYSTTSARPVKIVDNTATINITNAFSRVITPGNYYWDIRIVTDPEYDGDGNVLCEDDTDEVHSLYAGRPEGLPKFIVPGVAVHV